MTMTTLLYYYIYNIEIEIFYNISNKYTEKLAKIEIKRYIYNINFEKKLNYYYINKR